MSISDQRERRSLGVAGRSGPRQREHARRRRRLLALGLGFLLLVGLYFAIDRLTELLAGGAAAPASSPRAATTALAFKAASYLPAGDIDGDGRPEQVAVSAAESALRKVALVTGTGLGMKMVGPAVTVPDFPIALKDLPRAKGLLVLSGLLQVEGEQKTVQVGDERAVLATGGEPDFRAWRLDRARGLVPVDYYALAAPLTPPGPDSLVVDRFLNVLWHHQGSELAGTYRVTTGKHVRGPAPTAATQAINFVTPVGTYPIATKVPGLPYFKENLPALDPKNPLGTRWIGFNVFFGDGALVWGIHGTTEPDQIGRWASEGCIRMLNAEIEALYERVTVGKTVLQIVDSRPQP